MAIYLKHPDALVDYAIDWSPGQLAGATITDSQWTALPDEPGGIVVTGDSVSDARVTARLEGGLAGHVYRIANRIELSDGRIDMRALTLRVEAR